MITSFSPMRRFPGGLRVPTKPKEAVMTRAAVVFALTLATTGLAAAQEPLAVYGPASPPKAATKEGEAQLKEKKDAARKVYADLQESLKKQYGKKVESWPEDKQATWG